MTRTIVLFALALCGCSSGPAQLGELRAIVLSISTPGLSVSLAASTCPTLGPGTTATIDGAPMELVAAGGSGPGLGPFLPSCQAPTFALTQFEPDAGVSQLRIFDETATFTTEVSSPGAVRSLWLDGGTLQAGGRATLVWPFDNEALHPEWTTLSLLPGDAGSSVLVPSNELEFSGSEVSFTVPTLPPGPVKVSLRSSSVRLSSCEGPASCILRGGVGELDATVVP